MRCHIVLIGLPGAGKSAAGQLVAAALGCPFCDVDTRVTGREGMGVAQLFAARGEAAFRAVEHAVMEEALGEPPQVIAAGGGWAAQPGNLERTADRAVVVHLACPPEIAAHRLAGTDDRPLLAGDMTMELRRLHAERIVFYEGANATVDTATRTVAEVADAVAVLARSVGGW